VAPPFREAEFDIMYNEGISKVGDIIDLGSAMDIITKRGAFFSYKDVRIGQGRENAKTFLKEHPEMAAEIDKAIRAQAGVGKVPVKAGKVEDEEEDEEAEE
jgi:recombination protein RecA